MSHIENSTSKITNLDLFERAVSRFHGASFHRNASSFRFYSGQSPCSHKVHLDGVNYEVGLSANNDGSYSLAADYFGNAFTTAGGHDGHRIKEAFGDKCTRLQDAYSAEYLHAQAAAAGFTTSEETLADGSIVVTANRY